MSRKTMSTDKLRELLEQVKEGIWRIDTGDLEDENPYALGDIWDDMDEVENHIAKSLECIAAIQKKIDQA